MKVINIHRRKINHPKEKVAQLFKTLATKDDVIWPQKKWPAMRFKDGIEIGSQGGHGRIRYTIVNFVPEESIVFEFTEPEGFIGTHALYIKEQFDGATEISHEIKMKTNSIRATFLWLTVIRWLHDALIEDAFDTVENYFRMNKKTRTYSLWVKILRSAYKRKTIKPKLQLD